MRGLVSAAHEHAVRLDTERHTFFEAVIGETPPLVGRTLRESGFRGRYQAAVVAIHRAGKRVQARLGDVKLRVGDTLLILTDPGFRGRYRDGNDFLLVSMLGGSPPVTSRSAWIVAGVALTIVLGSAVGILSILHLSLIGAVALVATKVLEPWEARSSVDLGVIVVIAAAFGLGAAMETSGVAAYLASALVGGLGDLVTNGVLLGVVAATVILTSTVTNNAAAVLVFPIATAAARSMGETPRVFAIAVAVAASVSFLTPIAYQTNLMVYGSGGYRFSDYLRLGVAVTVAVVPTILLAVRLL